MFSRDLAVRKPPQAQNTFVECNIALATTRSSAAQVPLRMKESDSTSNAGETLDKNTVDQDANGLSLLTNSRMITSPAQGGGLQYTQNT